MVKITKKQRKTIIEAKRPKEKQNEEYIFRGKIKHLKKMNYPNLFIRIEYISYATSTFRKTLKCAFL